MYINAIIVMDVLQDMIAVGISSQLRSIKQSQASHLQQANIKLYYQSIHLSINALFCFESSLNDHQTSVAIDY